MPLTCVGKKKSNHCPVLGSGSFSPQTAISFGSTCLANGAEYLVSVSSINHASTSASHVWPTWVDQYYIYISHLRFHYNHVAIKWFFLEALERRNSRAKIFIEVTLNSIYLYSCLYIYILLYGLNFILAVQFFDRNHEILEFYADFDDWGNFSGYL